MREACSGATEARATPVGQGHVGRITENKFAPFAQAGAARPGGGLDTRRQAFFCISPDAAGCGLQPANLRSDLNPGLRTARCPFMKVSCVWGHPTGVA